MSDEAMDLVNRCSAEPNVSVREKVFAIEKLMLKEFEQFELPVDHYFAHQTYGRVMHIAKGLTVTGKIHKYSQLNVMLSGELSVLTEDGIKRVKAPFIVVSPPGTKRIAYAHEDTAWLTIHGTDKTDVDDIEAEFIAQTEQEYIEFCAKQIEAEDMPWLGQQ